MVLLFKLLSLSLKTWKAQSEMRTSIHAKKCTMRQHRGMALHNAFLIISHSMAHKISCAIPHHHGQFNAILLPYVIRWNFAQLRQLHSLNLTTTVQMKKYQDIARMLGLPCSTPEEAVEAYAKAVYEELGEHGIEMNFKHRASMKRMEETFSWIGLRLMKINVQLTRSAGRPYASHQRRCLTMVTGTSGRRK